MGLLVLQVASHSGGFASVGLVGALMAAFGSSSLDHAHPWMGHDSGGVGCVRGGPVVNTCQLYNIIILYYYLLYSLYYSTYCLLFISLHALRFGAVSALVVWFEVVLLRLISCDIVLSCRLVEP